MRKKTALYLLASSALSLHAREIRTPYAASMSRTYHQAIIDNPQEEKTYLELWGAYHRKQAARAFDSNGNKTPISTILFNTSQFSALDLVSPVTRTTIDSTAQAELARNIVSLPNISYQEHGGHFGFVYNQRLNEKRRTGIRTVIPFKKIKVVNCNQPAVSNVTVYLNPDVIIGCPCTSGNIIGQQIFNLTLTPEVQAILAANSLTLNEVCVRTGNTFAYRLDFVSLLPVNPAFPATPLLMYGTSGISPLDDTYIGSENITNQTDSPSVNVIERDDFTPPPFPYGVLNNYPFTPLPGNGLGLSNNERAAFQPASSGTDYTPLSLDTTTQKRLWITPSFDSSYIFADNNPLAEVTFQTAQTTGVGDLDLEWYINQFVGECALLEARLGVRIPTAKRIVCPTAPCSDKRLLLQLPAGSNHHTELHVGGAVAWRPVSWFNFYADAMYSDVLKDWEIVFAPFYDMCVKNIGPCVCSYISWSYFVAHLQATLYDPAYAPFGFHVDYQLYAKQKDNVHFSKTKTADLLQNRVSLDPQNIEKHTDVRANTIHAEVFYDIENVCHIFAGGSYVISGKNAMQEADAYIGAAITF